MRKSDNKNMGYINLLTIDQFKRLSKESKDFGRFANAFPFRNDRYELVKKALYLRNKRLGFTAVGSKRYNYKKSKVEVFINWIPGKDIALILPILNAKSFPEIKEGECYDGTYYFGFYPSTKIDSRSKEAKALDAMRNNYLFKTGRSYSGCDEYYYNGNFYVSYYSDWYLVDKVSWFYDKEDDIFVCNKSIDSSTAKLHYYKIMPDILDNIYSEMTKTIEEPNLLLSLDDVNNSLFFIPDNYSNTNINKTDFCLKLTHDRYYSVEFSYRAKVEYSKIKDMCTSKRIINGKTVVTFGEYPTKKCNIDILDKTNLTNKHYTVNDYDSNEEFFVPLSLDEFIYDGKKYVEYNNECYEVETLTWTLDKDEKYATCNSSLFPIMRKYKSSKIVLKYLYKYFSKEIIPSKTRLEIKSVEKEEDKEIMKELILKNPIYGMLFNKGNVDIGNFEIDEEGKLILKK